MKNLLICILMFNALLFSQSNNAYQVELRNVKQIDAKTYEFDIFIKSPKEINVSAYQCIFTFNQKISTGVLNFTYVNNSSQMTNLPIKIQIVNQNNQMLLALASGPGLESISSEKCIGKFRLKSSTDFVKKEKINLLWNFKGDINTIFMGTNSADITKNFTYKPSK